MKVMAFNGSPRKNGNTAALLRRCLAAVETEGVETRFIQLGGSGIQPCRGCNACRKNDREECIIKNDPLNAWYAEMKEADGIILASPTYIWGVTGEMKIFLDRATYLARARLRAGNLEGSLKNKVGGALACHAFTGGVNAIQQMHSMFFNVQMIVPGVSYWPVATGLQPGDVEQDAGGLRYAEELGRAVARLVRRLDATKNLA